MDRTSRLGLVVAFGASIAACGGSTGQSPRSRAAPTGSRPAPFPSKAETLSFASQFAATRGPGEAYREVPFPWTVEGIPVSPGPEDPGYEGTAGAMLDELLAAAPSLRATAGMRCVAQAVATATLGAEGRRPEAGFEQFALARCGVGARSMAGTSVVTRGVAESQALPDATRDAIVGGLTPRLGDLGPGLVGMAVARSGDGTVTVLTHVAPSVTLETPRPVANAAGTVSVRGELRESGMKRVLGLINQGPTGFAECTVSSTVPLPRFWMECPLAPGDDAARIALYATPRGAPIALHLADLVGRREAATEPRRETYVPASEGPRRPVETPVALLAGVRDRVTEIRAAAGLTPVQFALAESVRLNTLVPAALARDLSTEQQLSLTRGILAGWDVQSPVPLRDGYYASSGAVGPPDAERWMQTALLQPALRRTFFDPSAAIVALGSAVEEGSVTAIAASWRVHGDRVTEQAAAEALLRRLERARAERGVAPPTLITDLTELDAALDGVRRGQRTMEEAMDSVIERAARRWRRSVAYYAFEATDLSLVQLPDGLLDGGELILSLGVTHHTLPESRWGSYVVGIVFTR